jgi:glycerophosphoryl diester phosphodiesterase
MKRKTSWILLSLFLIMLIILGLIYSIGGGIGYKEPVRPDILKGRANAYFAHRGVPDHSPENSRGAILRARQLGYNCLEVDLRKTADGDFILFHDGDCMRLLGIEAELSSLGTAMVEEQELLFNDSASSFKVLTLAEMLDEFGHEFLFYFDLKLKTMRDAEDLAQVIDSFGITGNSIVASADPAVILYLEVRHPGIMTALEGFNPGKEWMYAIIPKKLKPDFLSGFASKVNRSHVDWLSRRNLLQSRIVYGVDSLNYDQVEAFGLQNVIIDHFPGLVMK